jgi:hypothetical protein
MFLFGYVCLFFAVSAYVQGEFPIPRRYERLARALGAIAGIAFAYLGLRLFGGDGATMISNVLSLLLVFGGVLYALGLLPWRMSLGLVSRRVGWLLVVAALIVPSTLTLLALPVASLLLLTLRPMGEPHTVARISPRLGR